jgi:hypothetical protein
MRLTWSPTKVGGDFLPTIRQYQSLPDGRLVHVRARFLLDVAGRLAARDVRVRPNLQNLLRIGRPYCTILNESTFLSSAASLNTSEGMKHLSTPPLNHEGWAPPRSVTTLPRVWSSPPRSAMCRRYPGTRRPSEAGTSRGDGRTRPCQLSCHRQTYRRSRDPLPCTL